MILYLDTSALVKLYVEEENAALVREAVSNARLVATCEISYVEMRSAMARRYREGSLGRTAYRQIIRDIGNDWKQLFLIVISSQLVQDAGDIAERYRLRAYDAIHLASGLMLQTRAAEPVTFVCWDKALELSASAASLKVLNRN